MKHCFTSMLNAMKSSRNDITANPVSLNYAAAQKAPMVVIAFSELCRIVGGPADSNPSPKGGWSVAPPQF